MVIHFSTEGNDNLDNRRSLSRSHKSGNKTVNINLWNLYGLFSNAETKDIDNPSALLGFKKEKGETIEATGDDEAINSPAKLTTYFNYVGLDKDGIDKNLYEQLCNYSPKSSNDHTLEDIGVMFREISRRLYKGDIDKQTAQEMSRAVINKMTAPEEQNVKTEYDDFIENYKDAYIRDFVIEMFTELCDNNSEMLQKAIDSIYWWDRPLTKRELQHMLVEQNNWDERQIEKLKKAAMAGNTEFGEVFSAVFKETATIKSNGQAFDKDKILKCMTLLENYNAELKQLEKDNSPNAQEQRRLIMQKRDNAIAEAFGRSILDQMRNYISTTGMQIL